MGNTNNATINKKELENLVLSINTKVGEYIQSLKQQSSEEILNGSIQEAQKIISQILPVENGFKKMDECHTTFLSVLNNAVATTSSKNTQLDSGKDDLSKLDLSEMDFTPSENYRIPILKALIYLGGNAKQSDVLGFIAKEMKTKFKSADHEKGANGFEKLWIEMVDREKESMVNERLISEDKKNEQWEIIQNGIDFLAQHTS